MKNILLTILALNLLIGSLTANATLLGDNINGTIVEGPSGPVSIITDFTSLSIVDTGLEFTTTSGTDLFGQIWEISVDVDATSFTVDFFPQRHLQTYLAAYHYSSYHLVI